MAQTIQIKRSTSTATPSSLSAGELAYSSSSNKLFIGHPDGSTGPVVVGGTYYTGIIDGAASANTASKLVLRDGSGNFSAGTITATLSGNASTATALATARTIGGVSFDGTANINLPGVNTAGNQNTSGNAATATTLATARTISGVSFDGSANITLDTDDIGEGSNLYFTDERAQDAAASMITGGSHTNISVSYDDAAGTLSLTGAITYTDADARGAISVTDSGGDGSLSYNSSTGVITYTGPSASEVRSHLSAGTGVSYSGGEFSIGQAVGTTSNVTFNNVDVDGTLTSDDITSTNISVAGNATITGNLTVQGTTTTVDSNTVSIGDNIMVLNKDETGTPSQNAGLEIERGTATNVSLLWNETNDNWTVSDGSATAVILTASNFNSVYTGTIDGGSF